MPQAKNLPSRRGRIGGRQGITRDGGNRNPETIGTRDSQANEGKVPRELANIILTAPNPSLWG